MKKILILALTCFSIGSFYGQNVQIDGRLQPLLDEFFAECKTYGIEYHDKLFALEYIDIVNTLNISEKGSTLGRVKRNDQGEVIGIEVNWVAQLDPQILRVVAFHEFAHYFLEYHEHVCQDCGHIMSVVNSSYFEIVEEWDKNLNILFKGSPVYISKYGTAVTAAPIE